MWPAGRIKPFDNLWKATALSSLLSFGACLLLPLFHTKGTPDRHSWQVRQPQISSMVHCGGAGLDQNQLTSATTTIHAVFFFVSPRLVISAIVQDVCQQ
mmetsp:Transcript_95660/g.189625  ORF Transcript_95660/g.189625 Transcript_95660/m.189625 type:complete len:99 (-) Transcript_95660:21-317(-)